MTDPVNDPKNVADERQRETPSNRLWIVLIGALAALAVIWLIWTFTTEPDPEDVAIESDVDVAVPVGESTYNPGPAGENTVPRAGSVTADGDAAVAAMLSQLDRMTGDAVTLRAVSVNEVASGAFTIGTGGSETLVLLSDVTETPIEAGKMVNIEGVVRAASDLESTGGVNRAVVQRSGGFIEASSVVVLEE